MGSGYDAIVLARGTSRRLADVDKADLDPSGATLLERAVESVASAERVSVVADPRPLSRTVVWTREQPPPPARWEDVRRSQTLLPGAETARDAAVDRERPRETIGVDTEGDSMTLQDWSDLLCDELDIELDVDITQVLDLARDAAHAVERPAAPLTAFLVGYAAAARGGGADHIDTCAEVATLLIRRQGSDVIDDV